MPDRILAPPNIASATLLCPSLEGNYNCVTSFSSTAQPWSITQSWSTTGFDLYAFDKKEYIADAADHLDPTVSYTLRYNARCLAGLPGVSAQLVIIEVGDLDDRGKHYHFTNQNVLEMNAKDQLVSRYSRDGTLVDTMTCTRR
ncbi:hypothetical protein BH10BDE1_BH10BDE1_33710 [soil metagenome]